MPVYHQKKCTTPSSTDSTEGQSAPVLPSPQQFQRHLRELARGAIRIVLEDVMREELDALIGVGWGERSPERKGYRNGYYTRDLTTTTGRIEALRVPRDREGQFQTQVFERYRRDAPQVANGLTEMFVAGVSTHKVGQVAQTLMDVASSASVLAAGAGASSISRHPFRGVSWGLGRSDSDPEGAGCEHGFYEFPQTMHRYIRTSNAIESLSSNVRQRTDQIDVFTTETSCLTIVWATSEDIRLRKVQVATKERQRTSQREQRTSHEGWVIREWFFALLPTGQCKHNGHTPVGDNDPLLLA